MSKIFGDFDTTAFWKNSEYSTRRFIGKPVTDDMIESVQKTLGHQLPASYLNLMRTQNGGVPNLTCHRTLERTSWADDHVAIIGLFGLDRNKSYSLTGELGSPFWQEEWGYPEIGVYFASCPSGGHDMICMDYRKCGPQSEPSIVHVDQSRDFKITWVANSFEEFIRGLRSSSEFSK